MSKFLRDFVLDDGSEEIQDRLRNTRCSTNGNMVGAAEDPASRDMWLVLQRRATAPTLLLEPVAQGATLRPLYCRFIAWVFSSLVKCVSVLTLK